MSLCTSLFGVDFEKSFDRSRVGIGQENLCLELSEVLVLEQV